MSWIPPRKRITPDQGRRPSPRYAKRTPKHAHNTRHTVCTPDAASAEGAGASHSSASHSSASALRVCACHPSPRQAVLRSSGLFLVFRCRAALVPDSNAAASARPRARRRTSARRAWRGQERRGDRRGRSGASSGRRPVLCSACSGLTAHRLQHSLHRTIGRRQDRELFDMAEGFFRSLARGGSSPAPRARLGRRGAADAPLKHRDRPEWLAPGGLRLALRCTAGADRAPPPARC